MENKIVKKLNEIKLHVNSLLLCQAEIHQILKEEVAARVKAEMRLKIAQQLPPKYTQELPSGLVVEVPLRPRAPISSRPNPLDTIEEAGTRAALASIRVVDKEFTVEEFFASFN